MPEEIRGKKEETKRSRIVFERQLGSLWIIALSTPSFHEIGGILAHLLRLRDHPREVPVRYKSNTGPPPLASHAASWMLVCVAMDTWVQKAWQPILPYRGDHLPSVRVGWSWSALSGESEEDACWGLEKSGFGRPDCQTLRFYLSYDLG